MGSVNVCRPAMKVTLLIHCLRGQREKHTHTPGGSGVTLSWDKRVRFLADEISQIG